MMRSPVQVLIRCAVLMLGVAAAPTVSQSATGADAWRDAGQLVLVTTSDWNANEGLLRKFRKANRKWQAVGSASSVTIGRAGAGWGTGLHPAQPGPAKKEGDGRSPAGVFRIGSAFGYPKSVRTALPYEAMDASDYCIDVSDSPLYNRIVDARKVGDDAIKGSTEPMRRDLHVDGDQRYKLGFIIEHNSAGVSGLGSCIFAHLWKAPGAPTAGCTAMPESAMEELLSWLRPDLEPIFVLLPIAEYERLEDAWHLPNTEEIGLMSGRHFSEATAGVCTRCESVLSSSQLASRFVPPSFTVRRPPSAAHPPQAP